MSLKGLVPESWCCVDCNVNTAPGMLNRAAAEDYAKALGKRWTEGGEGIPQYINERSEIYYVHDKIWKKAGMGGMGGCLCIGCPEKRIGRRLKPKDFDPDHPFNEMPGTPRLLDRGSKKIGHRLVRGLAS
jgi:hypothetical protein